MRRNAIRLEDLGPRARAQLEHVKQAKPNKYGAKRTPYTSRSGISRLYDSKAEANYASTLDYGIVAGLVEWWVPQVPFPLPGSKTYRLDFLVKMVGGQLRLVDVKGHMTPVSKLKIDQVEALYGVEVEIVR